MKKISTAILAVLTTVIMAVLCACGGAMSEEPALSGFTSDGEQVVPVSQQTAGFTSNFLDHPEYDGKVTNADEALDCLYSLMDQLGGDEKVELVLHDEIQNEEQTVYYSFEQALGSIQVFGGSVKLIVDKDGKVLGAASTLVNGLEEVPEDAWEITQEEAEYIISENYLEPGEKVIPELTEQTLLPFFDGTTRYVWVVYCSTSSPEAEKAYVAKYVTGTGEFLYSVPVSTPGNDEALNGSVSVFAFEGYEEGTWTGTVKDSDGLEREITVPIMIDQETGLQYMGDMQRKILCADYTDFEKNDTLTPITSTDGTWSNNEIISYEMIIRVWDFYDSVGWHGPDGAGTPTLILMNLVDDEGKPIDNAYYSGKKQGFQTFSFNDEFGDGSCSDIVGHEYTHCLTCVSRIHDFYFNDMGAINESISDIMGNLIEMMFGDSPNGEWLFSERHSNGVLRNMKDPHEKGQPAYTWDLYYLPNAEVPEEDNDRGGVHRNDSILNLVSYKLDQAGMSPEDQFYFWMNVDLAQTSMTDYPMMAKILPFVLDMCGYGKYKDALNQAIADVRMADKSIPTETSDDTTFVGFELPFDPEEQNCAVGLFFISKSDGETSYIWPMQGTNQIGLTVPEGDYFTYLVVAENVEGAPSRVFVLSADHWIEADMTDRSIEDIVANAGNYRQDNTLHFDGGKVYNVETDSLAELMNQ